MDGFEFDAERRRATVSGDLTIHETAAVHGALLGAIDAGLLELDLGEVSEIDTAGLQLLVALERAVDGLATTARSEAVENALRTAGLDATNQEQPA